MLFGNEHESSPPLSRVSHFKFDIDQQTSQVLFYITALAIMQDFRDDEKIFLNDRQLAILDFISAKFVIGYPCVSPDILFYRRKRRKMFIRQMTLKKYKLNNMSG